MRSKHTSAPNARSYAPRPPKECERRLYGIYLAHYAVRVLLALILEPEEATEPLLARLRHKLAQHVLPARRLRINRREVKQVYNKYKPKKRQLPPPEPFDPDAQFLDFVDLLDPLASGLLVAGP